MKVLCIIKPLYQNNEEPSLFDKKKRTFSKKVCREGANLRGFVQHLSKKMYFPKNQIAAKVPI